MDAGLSRIDFPDLRSMRVPRGRVRCANPRAIRSVEYGSLDATDPALGAPRRVALSGRRAEQSLSKQE